MSRFGWKSISTLSTYFTTIVLYELYENAFKKKLLVWIFWHINGTENGIDLNLDALELVRIQVLHLGKHLELKMDLIWTLMQ